MQFPTQRATKAQPEHKNRMERGRQLRALSALARAKAAAAAGRIGYTMHHANGSWSTLTQANHRGAAWQRHYPRSPGPVVVKFMAG